MDIDVAGWARDAEALRVLGARLAARRLERNQTQAQLARESGVSLRTVVRLERGESSQLTNLVRVLRALELLGPLMASLEALAPPPQARPLAQLRSKARTRRRASRRRAPAKGESPWTWRDEPGEAAP